MRRPERQSWSRRAVEALTRENKQLMEDKSQMTATVQELVQHVIDCNSTLLRRVATELGETAPQRMELKSRHSQMELGPGARVYVTAVRGVQCMALTPLLEALGIHNARDYTQKSLMPYFVRAGVCMPAPEHTLRKDRPSASSRASSAHP